jgi:hypothetical protein
MFRKWTVGDWITIWILLAGVLACALIWNNG